MSARDWLARFATLGQIARSGGCWLDGSRLRLARQNGSSSRMNRARAFVVLLIARLAHGENRTWAFSHKAAPSLAWELILGSIDSVRISAITIPPKRTARIITSARSSS